jgi:hypothetical protein
MDATHKTNSACLDSKKALVHGSITTSCTKVATMQAAEAFDPGAEKVPDGHSVLEAAPPMQ